MKLLKKIYYTLFVRYRRLELQGMFLSDADRLLRQNEGKPEGAQWRIAHEEDYNRVPGIVWLERRVRVRE